MAIGCCCEPGFYYYSSLPIFCRASSFCNLLEMDPIIRNLLAIIFIIVAFAIPIASDQADHNLKCVPNEESILLGREGNRTERQSLRRARNNLAGAGSLKIFSQRLKAECKNLAIADLSNYFSSANATPNGCSSQNGTASCCANLNVDFKFVHVHQYVCLNITYFHLSKSIRILVDIDGYAVFQFTLSATNPPPVCLPFMIGELCIKLYKLKVDTGVFSGCAGLELYLMHQKVMYIKLGCFNLPFLEERSGIVDGSY